MGYREYAKDYEIEYVPREGKGRPRARRIYVGPYFRFRAAPAVICRRKWQYLVLLAVQAAALLVPLSIDCGLTRVWYASVPAAAAWIPWLLAGCSVWRLWTAREPVEREHNDLLHDRMRGASFFLMGFTGISTLGAAVWLSRGSARTADLAVCGALLAGLVCAAAMFALCRDLQMERVENPEKPQAQK